MKHSGPAREFRVSEMIYRRLLLAYPRPHRAAYGAAMAQLFRDQCRDAWDESRHRGLAGLWLRVLPDLASTSILERLAALKERKTMTDKIANLSAFRTAPAAIFLKVFATVFLLVFITSVAVTFILPETYASTARILIRPDVFPAQGPAAAPDANFIQTAYDILDSQNVLLPVIDHLKLNEIWGRKYFNGQTLDTMQSLKILMQRVELHPIRNTSLVSITVYSDDRVEAADLANAIAKSYQDYRIRNHDGPASLSQPVLVQITDPAKPGFQPVKPNKTLNIALGAVLGIALAASVGALAVFFSRLRSSKTANAA